MKTLQPHQISSEVLEVIHSAQQYLILVSPYVKLTQWQQLAAALTAAKGRGVRIDFFVRNEPDNAGRWEQVEALGLKARLVSNLHAKFYFSETSGVISSMNLLASSNSNSIEIGCKLETQTELDELKSFVKRFVVPHEMSERPTQADLYLTKERFSVALLSGSASSPPTASSKPSTAVCCSPFWKVTRPRSCSPSPFPTTLGSTLPKEPPLKAGVRGQLSAISWCDAG